MGGELCGVRQGGFAIPITHPRFDRLSRWGVVPAVLVLSVSLLCVDAPGAGAASSRVPNGSSGRLAHSRPTDGSSKGISFISGPHRLKAGGKTWYLAVFASKESIVTSVTVELSRQIAASSYELHQWTLAKAPSSSITSISSSKWRIHPPKTAASPLMAVDLVFTEKKVIRVACKKGSETEYHGSLAGTVYLVSGLKKIGTLGSKTARISFSTPNIATVDDNCVPKHVPPGRCTNGYSAFITGSAQPYPLALASSFGTTDYLSMSETTTLSKPKDAIRFDFVLAAEPKMTRQGSVFHVTTSGSAITGSATLDISGTHPFQSTSSCTIGGTKHTETVTDYFGASVSNKSLTGRPLASGLITLGKNPSGSVTVASYK